MDTTTLREALASDARKGVTEPALNTLLTRLYEHGEVFVELQSGKTLALHLGDKGALLGDTLTVHFGNGETHTFFGNQIVEVWTHRASYE